MYVLEAEPGKPDIIRRDDVVNMRSMIDKKGCYIKKTK